MSGKRNLAQRLATPLLVAGGTALVWGTCIERHWYTLRTESLPVLPRGSRPLRVLHLSDLHLAPWQTHRAEWVRSLASEAPDLVVLTGDLMGHTESIEPLRYALEVFRGTPGVFVHGSNDYYGPILKNPLKYLKEPSRLSTREQDIDNVALTAMLRDDLGFTDLNNTASDLLVSPGGRDSDSLRVRFFGLDDPHIRFEDPALMRDTLQPLDNAEEADVRVGVVHAPYVESLNNLLTERADVIFAGHTHGGQVRIPGVGALTSNSDLSPKQARGLSVWFDDQRAAFLHVSAGLGHSIYAPVRFACRPEATLLTFTAPEG